jgi:putative transposase
MEPKNDPTRRIIQIDEGLVQSQVTQMVKETVEETLNAMLDAEADRLIQAEKYERTDARKDTRAGHYKRKLDEKCRSRAVKAPHDMHLDHYTMPW